MADLTGRFRAYPELRAKLLATPEANLISDKILPRAHEIAHLAAIEVQAGRLRPSGATKNRRGRTP